MKLITWPYYSKEFLKSQGLSVTIPERFWSKVSPKDGCWIWEGSRLKGSGYGQISKGFNEHGPARANRVSWILHFGPIPEGMDVCHHCDNPPCVNPDHLFLGNDSANAMDKVQKGRWRGNTKLTREVVQKIRSISGSQKQLADEFGIHQSQVSRIINGKRWRHA